MTKESYKFNQSELERLSAQAREGYRLEKEVYQTYISPGLEVLDIGSGNGTFARTLAENFTEAIFQGIELNEELYKISKTWERENLSFIQGNILDIQNVKILKKDVMILRFVMQHIQNSDWDRLFSAIRQFLKKDGILVITEANASSLQMYRSAPELEKIHDQVVRQRYKNGFDQNTSLKVPFIMNNYGFKLRNVKALNLNTQDIGKENFFNLFFSCLHLYLPDKVSEKYLDQVKEEYENNCSFACCNYFLFAGSKI